MKVRPIAPCSSICKSFKEPVSVKFIRPTALQLSFTRHKIKYNLYVAFTKLLKLINIKCWLRFQAEPQTKKLKTKELKVALFAISCKRVDHKQHNSAKELFMLQSTWYCRNVAWDWVTGLPGKS